MKKKTNSYYKIVDQVWHKDKIKQNYEWWIWKKNQ